MSRASFKLAGAPPAKRVVERALLEWEWPDSFTLNVGWRFEADVKMDALLRVVITHGDERFGVRAVQINDMTGMELVVERITLP